MSRMTLVVIALALIIIGIAGLIYILSTPGYLPGVRGPSYPDTGYPIDNDALEIDYESNGQMIYYTGYNHSRQRIDTSRGPHWFYVHGGSCVHCHGEDGRGGVPIMMGYVVPADITYDGLTSEEHAGHEPYTEETIRRAIRSGVDPEGRPLDPTMPRWDMKDEDMDDLIDYLRTL
jgi:mono/diheme cytochrome c family protein